MYKIVRMGGGLRGGVQKSYTRTDPTARTAEGKGSNLSWKAPESSTEEEM